MPVNTLSDNDRLTIVKLLAAGRDAEFVAAAVQVARDVVIDVASRHGHPNREKLAWAADILQANIDKQRQSVIPVHRPQPAARPPQATRAVPRGPDVVASTPDGLQVGLISVAKIIAHPSNIGRDLGDLRDLVASVKAKGVLVPIVLEKQPGGLYRLRDGHRRLAATRLAKVGKVTALIHSEPLDEADWLIESLDYNERRKGYTEDDKRRVALRLRELGVGKVAIAEAFGCPWSQIARLIEPRTAQPASLAEARRQVARQSTVVSRKVLCEFVSSCEEQGYAGADVLVMLRALLDGRPWRTVDEAVVSEDVSYA